MDVLTKTICNTRAKNIRIRTMVMARPAIDEMKKPKGVEPKRKTLSIKQRDNIKNIKRSVA
jgi:hypothetical protein